MEETEYDMFNRQVDELMESPQFSSGTFSLFCLLFIYSAEAFHESMEDIVRRASLDEEYFFTALDIGANSCSVTDFERQIVMEYNAFVSKTMKNRTVSGLEGLIERKDMYSSLEVIQLFIDWRREEVEKSAPIFANEDVDSDTSSVQFISMTMPEEKERDNKKKKRSIDYDDGFEDLPVPKKKRRDRFMTKAQEYRENQADEIERRSKQQVKQMKLIASQDDSPIVRLSLSNRSFIQ